MGEKFLERWCSRGAPGVHPAHFCAAAPPPTSVRSLPPTHLPACLPTAANADAEAGLVHRVDAAAGLHRLCGQQPHGSLLMRLRPGRAAGCAALRLMCRTARGGRGLDRLGGARCKCFRQHCVDSSTTLLLSCCRRHAGRPHVSALPKQRTYIHLPAVCPNKPALLLPAAQRYVAWRKCA